MDMDKKYEMKFKISKELCLSKSDSCKNLCNEKCKKFVKVIVGTTFYQL